MFVSLVFVLFFAFIIVMEVKIYNLETRRNAYLLSSTLMRYKSEELKRNVDSIVRFLGAHSKDILGSTRERMIEDLSDIYLLCFHTYVFNRTRPADEVVDFIENILAAVRFRDTFIISYSGKIIYFPMHKELVGKNVYSVRNGVVAKLAGLLKMGVKKYLPAKSQSMGAEGVVFAFEYFEPLKIYVGIMRETGLRYVSSMLSSMMSRLYKQREAVSVVQIINKGNCFARVLIDQENPQLQGECLSEIKLPAINRSYFKVLKDRNGMFLRLTVMKNGHPVPVVVYMRLYKPLNWVVESWFYPSEVYGFVSNVEKEFRREIKKLLLSFIPTITALFILGIIYLILMAKIQEAESVLRELTREAMTTQVPISRDRLPHNLVFNSREFQSMVDTMNEIVEYFNKNEEEIIESFIVALETRDIYTKGHSQRVAYYSKVIAEAIGLPEEKQMRIYTAGLLHDIGKIGIPDYILLKPELLTDQEYEIVKYHPLFSYYILKEIGRFKDIAEMVKYHHERCDGSGYPDGKVCDEIPLESRILAMADIFDALTTKRPYRGSIPPEEAIHMLEIESVDGNILKKAGDVLKDAYVEEENVEVRFTPAELEKVRQYLFRMDTLTGLPKKEILVEKMNSLVEKNIGFVLCMIRFNNLHRINYEVSFLVGDKVIGYAGNILKELVDMGEVPRCDIMSRVFEGAFVFVKTVSGPEEVDEVRNSGEKLKALLSKDLRMILVKRHPNLKTGDGIHVSDFVDFDVSCVVYPDDAETVSSLIRECERRMKKVNPS